MKSITIHGLDDEMDEQIRNRAGAAGLSLNKTIKLLLEGALGMRGRPLDRRKEFEDLSGAWSSADLESFSLATDDFGRIDAEDWK